MKYKKENNRLVFTCDKNMTIMEFFNELHLSKKTIHLLQQNKKYTLNNNYASINTLLKPGDRLSIEAFDSGIDYKPQKYPLEIIYEDDLLCIINKPEHTIIYPENKDGMNSLCNYVAYYYKQTNQNYPIRHLHRLDKETTGLMMFCKCQLLQPYFDHIIETKQLEKTYLACITGRLPKKNMSVSLSIGRNRHHSQKMIISKSGKDALTHFKELKYKNNESLVECVIETGRKHQIRVHLSSLNHPIIGDILYGGKNNKHMMLHAYRLSFIHPITHKKMDIICDIPDYMKRF